MSRSKSRYTTADYTPQTRVTGVNATSYVRPVVVPRPFTYSPILLLEDRRAWHPDGEFRLPAARYRSSMQLVAKVGKNGRLSRLSPSVRSFQYNAPPVGVGFRRPDHVAICVRRAIRRAVLFAAGVGGKRVRPGKRTYESGFRCN